MSQSTGGHTLIIQIILDNSGDAIRYKIEQVTVAEGKIPTAQTHFDCIHCRAKYFISPKIVQLMELEMIPDEEQASEVKKEPEFDWLESGSSMEVQSDDGDDEEQDIEPKTLVASNDNVKRERELYLLESGSSDELPSDDEADILQGVEQEIPVATVNNLKIQPHEIVENENPNRIQPLDLHPFDGFVMTDAEMKDQDQHNVPFQKKKEIVDSDIEKTQGDGFENSEMDADMTFPMDADPDFVETPPVMYQMQAEQMSESEESEVLTPSEERLLMLKSKCLQSEVVIRLFRVDEEARETDASVSPTGPQERNVEGGHYTCDICKSTFKHRYSLYTHIRYMHLGIRLSCSKCQETFSDNSALNKHKRNIHQSDFRTCEVCKWSKTCTKAEYNSHLRHRHPEFHIKGRHPKVQDFNGVDYPCIYCDPQATFESFEELKEHLEATHNRNFACTRCPKAWDQQSNLKYHIESIHEKKTFSCPNCDKVFTWKRYFKKHLRSHK